MTATERDRMRATIVGYMRMYPMRPPLDAHELTWLDRLRLMADRHRTSAGIAVIAVVVLALGGGMSVAAQGALPGDLLYAVKTEINERVRTAVAISAEAEARVHADIAAERVSEAVRLAAEGRLDADVSERLDARFNERADRAQQIAIKLESESAATAAADVASHLESALTAHAVILTKIEAETPSEREAVTKILNSLATHIKDAADVRAKSESEAADDPNAQTKEMVTAKMAATAQTIAEARAYGEKAKARLGERADAPARQELALAEELFAEAKAKLENEQYGEAFARFSRSHRTARQALVLARTQADFGIAAQSKPESAGAVSSAATTTDPHPDIVSSTKGAPAPSGVATSTPLDKGNATTTKATTTLDLHVDVELDAETP